MKTIKQKEGVNAEVKVPASKSYTNRALLIAALADGKSVLKDALVSDDTRFMRKALEDMGINIEEKGGDLVVHGKAGKLSDPGDELFIGNAGTAMRFLTSAISLAQGEVVLTGNERMKKRPIKDLVSGLEQLGVRLESNDGYPPVKIQGGSFFGGRVKIKGDKSSQYFSSIMMAAPYAKEDVEINVEGELTSKSYIDITMDIMKTFGVKVKNEDYKRFIIKTGKYSARGYHVEGDASSAAYFFAAAAITKGKVTVKGINPDSVQGDINFPYVLTRMGCEVEIGKDSITVKGNDLKGIDIDMNHMPDSVQTLAVVSLFAKGETKINNIANLRIKETDRIDALANELRKLGAEVIDKEDCLVIVPKKDYQGAEIETYEDHRMAMSFALAGLKIGGVKIKNPGCVSKSFPDFWDVFEGM